MGLETKTTARFKGGKFVGKLHVDSKSIQFTSKDLKWSAALTGLKASSKAGWIVVNKGDERIEFEVSETGEKWVQKILNPPNRMEKMGVKSDAVCWLSKGFDRSFVSELKSTGASTTRSIEKCTLAFLLLEERGELIEIKRTAELLSPTSQLWIVWPKGVAQIGQSDVMTTTKSLGYGPSKTAAFDEHHSSMRFAMKQTKR